MTQVNESQINLWNFGFDNQFDIEKQPTRGQLVLIDKLFNNNLQRSVILALYTGENKGFGPEYYPIASLSINGTFSIGVNDFTRPTTQLNPIPRVIDIEQTWTSSRRILANEENLEIFLKTVISDTNSQEVTNIRDVLNRFTDEINPEILELVRKVISRITQPLH